ncbi:DUF2207 family protein [Streptomyces sp. 900116325]
MTLTEQLYWGGAGLIVLWLAVFGLALVATRNGTVTPGPATQDFGADPEPPAVVSLLGNQWRGVEHAAAATLLDLAARGLVELRQPGDDPARSTVHLTEAGRAAQRLMPYEQRVLDRVTARAANGSAPIGAIAFRDDERAASWNTALRREIIAEARLRGLSRYRFAPLLGSALLVGAFVPGALFAVAAVMGGHGVRAALFVGVAPGAALAFLLGKALGERATPKGLERAGHWAGLRAWLTAHEDFAQLPPASVTVWDRYLAYGTALGVTVLTSRLLGFDSGDRRRVWSSYGGTWRPVRIRYPRLRRLDEPAAAVGGRGGCGRGGALGLRDAAAARLGGRGRRAQRRLVASSGTGAERRLGGQRPARSCGGRQVQPLDAARGVPGDDARQLRERQPRLVQRCFGPRGAPARRVGGDRGLRRAGDVFPGTRLPGVAGARHDHR